MKLAKLFILFAFFILLINSVYFANGFGLSMSYDDNDRPLLINYGETKEIDFLLLSSARESNKKIRVDILEGGEIASLDKNEFDLPSDGEVKGFIKIKAPEIKEKKDNEYLVTILIKDISPSDEPGTVKFSFSSKISFIVKINEEPEEKLPEFKNNWYLFLLIILIIIIILILFILKRRKSYS